MKRLKLNYSKVEYDREAHIYTLNGVRLSGITKMIKNQLFPDEYKGISQDILNKAAIKGSLVHENCQYYDEFGVKPQTLDSIQEELIKGGYDLDEALEKADYVYYCINRYAELKEQFLGEHLVSEYVVSDNKNFASPIDVIYQSGEKSVILADIKSVSKLNKEMVSWQLSIYAKWFEELNPDITVSDTVVIWLPEKKYGEPMVCSLERKSKEEVQRLLDCEANGMQYIAETAAETAAEKSIVVTDPKIPTEVAAMTQYVTDTLQAFKAAEEKKKEMIVKVQVAMQTFNIKSWTTDSFSFSQSADSERRTLDIKKLKETYPEIDFDDDRFYKKTKVKGGFTAKLK